LPVVCAIATLGITGFATFKGGSSNPIAPVVAAGVAAAAAAKAMSIVWGTAAVTSAAACYTGPVQACVLRVGDTFIPKAKQ
jgi:hypothetical protein